MNYLRINTQNLINNFTATFSNPSHKTMRNVAIATVALASFTALCWNLSQTPNGRKTLICTGLAFLVGVIVTLCKKYLFNGSPSLAPPPSVQASPILPLPASSNQASPILLPPPSVQALSAPPSSDQASPILPLPPSSSQASPMLPESDQASPVQIQSNPSSTGNLHELVKMDDLSEDDIKVFFAQNPHCDINQSDADTRTPLYRAINRSNPSKALIKELIRREGQYTPGNVGLTTQEFESFFKKATSPGVVTLAILEVSPNCEVLLDYVLAFSLSESEDPRLSRIAASIILDYNENQKEAINENLAMLRGLQADDVLSHDLRDPLGIIASYAVAEGLNRSDANKVRSNLANLRRQEHLDL